MLHMGRMPGPGQSSLCPPHGIATSKATSVGNFMHLKCILLFLSLPLIFLFVFWVFSFFFFGQLHFIFQFIKHSDLLPGTKQIGVICFLNINVDFKEFNDERKSRCSWNVFKEFQKNRLEKAPHVE